uniref:Trypsin-like serine protease n=1 Tax=Rhizobium laguerreae TaxID=1076926 RepID=A0A6N9ZSL1_9HYPH|nr:trypsin-like serine protease [Rhizobium laguerreae]
MSRARLWQQYELGKPLIGWMSAKRWSGDGIVRKSSTFILLLAVFTFLFARSELRADSAEAPWVVEVVIDSAERCSGSVLAERWILTTARCLKGFGMQANVTVYYADREGTPREIYDGRSVLHAHRYYQGQAFPTWVIDIPNADYDVGLIELIRGSIDLSVTGRAKLYTPSRPKPWSTAGANRDFVMIGWGNTDDPVCSCLGNTAEPGCESTTTGRKFLGTGYSFDEAQRNAESLRSHSEIFTCLASSGAPWLLLIGGEYLVIAVEHGTHYPFDQSGYTYHYAALISTKTDWIWDASRNLRYEPTTGNYTAFGLSCGGGVGDPGYIECFERDGGTVVPPPPVPLCPRGRHCCEPMGDECRRCIPDGAQCQ